PIWLRRARVSVVTGELPQRPFLLQFAGMEQALDHDLRMRRNWQTHDMAGGEFDRPFHQRTGRIKLGFLRPEHERSRDKGRRIDAIGCYHFARLALRPPGFTIEATVLSRRTIEPDPIVGMQHLSIDADIDAPGCRIARKWDV